MSASAAAPRHPSAPTLLSGGADNVEAEYAGDDWDARRLGVTARRGQTLVRFGGIDQGWLRDAVKRWSRFRLSTGYAFGTITSGVRSLGRFSEFLDHRHPSVDDASGVTRDLLVDYLSWMATSRWGTSTRSQSLTFVKVFLDWGRRHGTLDGLPADAVIYEEEVSRPADALPRFIPEFVMAQLESEANLARIANPTARHLLIVLMETGMRGGDACELAFNPLIDDSAGWPCLRFANSKLSNEQLIPLSAKAAKTIRAQQAHVRRLFPLGSPWLFPGILENADGAKPYAHVTMSAQLRRWQQTIDVRDEAGLSVHVAPHQFRHTVGTRLINAGVPQHVIQKLLGHASPRMTARYAQIHDHTVRDAFEHYCRRRVNVTGEAVPYDPGALTAEAEWVKHNLSRVRDSLPNGYCGRPPQQDCPHPNACLTCPDFQTTPEFLDVHRAQATANRKLIARADANGHFRLAENLRQVQASLDHIIPALETLDESDTTS